MNKAKIDNRSLINNYLPADYVDSFSKEVFVNKNITPDTFFDMAFNHFPGWISWLLRVRNILVKPLGLDVKSRFSDSVRERNANEIIWGMPDTHLNFHVSVWCGELHDNKQELRITTVVKFNNTLGRLYFFVIKLFHGVIVRSLLNNTQKQLYDER